jgi:hypothetical protein
MAGAGVRIMDNIIEALLLSYHYLGSINKFLQAGKCEIQRYIHLNNVYARQSPKYLKQKDMQQDN